MRSTTQLVPAPICAARGRGQRRGNAPRLLPSRCAADTRCTAAPLAATRGHLASRASPAALAAHLLLELHHRDGAVHDPAVHGCALELARHHHHCGRRNVRRQVQKGRPDDRSHRLARHGSLHSPAEPQDLLGWARGGAGLLAEMQLVVVGGLSIPLGDALPGEPARCPAAAPRPQPAAEARGGQWREPYPSGARPRGRKRGQR